MRLWSLASELAAKTPAERNRYVDFLRAASIIVVITGHWLITTIHYVDGELNSRHIFTLQPATQWLTWAFQVMPIFFIVGGYSNAVSLESASRRGIGYGDWLATRLHRLGIPLLALIATWTLLAAVMHLAGTKPAIIQLITRAAMIPTWFLAIYTMVVILAPLAHRLWRRYGFGSFALLATIAVLLDLLFFAAELQWPSWSNYFWIWLAIHSLGFAWRDGRFGKPGQLLLMSAGALGLLWILVFPGPYPLAMVGTPDMSLSNTTPPKTTLIVLGIFQFSLLLAIEKPMRKALAGTRLWTATVLVNSMIMSIYLWHLTVMLVFIGVLYLAGGTGLGLEPGSLAWWLSRPLWFLVLLLLLVPLALAVSPLERSASASRTLPPWRQVVGATMICLAIALITLHGYASPMRPWLDLLILGLLSVGAAGSGLLTGLILRLKSR